MWSNLKDRIALSLVWLLKKLNADVSEVYAVRNRASGEWLKVCPTENEAESFAQLSNSISPTVFTQYIIIPVYHYEPVD